MKPFLLLFVFFLNHYYYYYLAKGRKEGRRARMQLCASVCWGRASWCGCRWASAKSSLWADSAPWTKTQRSRQTVQSWTPCLSFTHTNEQWTLSEKGNKNWTLVLLWRCTYDHMIRERKRRGRFTFIKAWDTFGAIDFAYDIGCVFILAPSLEPRLYSNVRICSSFSINEKEVMIKTNGERYKKRRNNNNGDDHYM